MRTPRVWLSLALLAAAAGGGIAWAQGDGSKARPPAALDKGEKRADERGRFAVERHDFLAGVAERLGVGVDELKEAIAAEARERVDAAVAEGRLSEKQAARIRERIESGGPPFGLGAHPGRDRFDGAPGERRSYGHRGKGHGALKHAAVEAAGDYLEMESHELFRALREGKGLADLAEEKGKSADGLAAAVLEAVQAKLDAAVAEGRLTEDEATRLRERAEEAIARLLERRRG